MAKNVDITSYKATVKIDTRAAVKSVESLQKALKSLDKQLSMSTTGKAFDKLKQTAKLQEKSSKATQKAAKDTSKIKADGAKAEIKSYKKLIRKTETWVAGNLNFHKLRIRNSKEALQIEREITRAAARGDYARVASLKKQVKLANQTSGGGGGGSRRGGGVRAGAIAGLTASNVLAGLTALGTGALVGGITSTSNKYQQAEISLEAAMLGSGHFNREGWTPELQQEAIQNQKAFAYTMATNYGLDQASTTMDLGKFMVSALSTKDEEKMNISQIQSLFQGLSKQGVLYGLGQDQMKRAMNAFTQMANKGQIKAEELKNQLGDVLPGAMKLFADAIDKTQGELLEMMDRGELLAWDVLPKVAIEMNRVAGIGGKFEEALSKPAKQIDILVSWLKDLAIGMGMQFEKPFSDLLTTINSFIEEFRTPIAEIGGSFIEAFMVDAKGALESFLGFLKPYLNQWKSLTAEAKADKIRTWASSIQNAFAGLFGLFAASKIGLTDKLVSGFKTLLDLFKSGGIAKGILGIGKAVQRITPWIKALAVPLMALTPLITAVAGLMGVGGMFFETSEDPVEAQKQRETRKLAKGNILGGSIGSVAELKNINTTPSGKDYITASKEQHILKRQSYPNVPTYNFDVSVEQNNNGSGVLSMDEMERRGSLVGQQIAQSASEQMNNYMNSSGQQ